MTTTFGIFGLLQKSMLWGSIDGRKIFDTLEHQIRNSPTEIIDIDLSSIESFDQEFINKVFIETLKIIESLGGTKSVILTNVNNGEIIYQISIALKRSNFFVLYRSDKVLKMVGDVSLQKKNILQKIEKGKQFSKKDICIQGSSYSCECISDLEKFVKLGYIKKVDNDVYDSKLTEVV